jgi:hypothetical protein
MGGGCITFQAAISQIRNVNIVTWQLRAGIVEQEDTAVTVQQQRNCCKRCFLFSPCQGYIARTQQKPCQSTELVNEFLLETPPVEAEWSAVVSQMTVHVVQLAPYTGNLSGQAAREQQRET